jgi:hypothetical protein
MQELTKKAITGLIWLQSIMAVMLFVPAGTLHLGGVGFLASLLGVVDCRHVLFSETWRF